MCNSNAAFFNMKKVIFFVLLTFGSIRTSTQNLIPNPSFEDYTQCPNKEAQISLTGNWYNANYGSVDYYNECATGTTVGVPQNVAGLQVPRTGKAYLGMYLYSEIENAPIQSEYFSTELTQSLKANKGYYFEMYANNSGLALSTNAIEVYFSKTMIKDSVNDKTLNFIPQISASDKPIITDTLGWTKISGCFIAKGDEKYIIVGNFKKWADTKMQRFPNKRGTAYYFFGLNIENNLSLCGKDSILLDASITNPIFQNATWKWQDGSNQAQYTIKKKGVYAVDIQLDKCLIRDSIIVTKEAPLPFIGKDTSICQGKKITLKPSQLYDTYTWQDGSNTPSLVVNKSGLYTLLVKNYCGTSETSIRIDVHKCDCNIFVPTAFSPNNDGANDELQAFINCDIPIKVKRFQVFNRWGNLLFTQSNTNDIRWNGQVNGTQLDQGTFVWYMEYEIEKNGKTETKIEYGDFTIIL
jgi:gliding motility-associated-like protein